MLKLKVKQIGNSAGVVLPKEALNHLNVDKGDEIFLALAAGELSEKELASWFFNSSESLKLNN